MKKLFIGAFALLLINNYSQAQTRPTAGDKSFTVGVSGIDFMGFNTNISRTGTVLFRKYYADDKAYRASANLTTNITNMRIDDTTNGTAQISSSSNFFISLAGGLQKSLGQRERLEPYVGFDALLGYGRSSNTIRTEVINPDKTGANDSKGDYQQTATKNANPINFGVTPLIGFNYYIADGLAIGGEFGYGLNMSFTTQSKQVFSRREQGVDKPKNENVFSPGGLNLSLQNMNFANVALTILF